MSAKIINLVLEQGTDFESTFTIYNENNSRLNLFGYNATSHIKKSPYSSVYYPFNISFPDRINGKLSLSMPKLNTSNLDGGRYVYDVVLISPNNKTTRVISGSVLVIPGVTL